tara:strand:- start:397 stop:642 length:246 start_codon:yes stop_codon:yes gene_type:complete
MIRVLVKVPTLEDLHITTGASLKQAGVARKHLRHEIGSGARGADDGDEHRGVLKHPRIEVEEDNCVRVRGTVGECVCISAG